MDIAYLLGIHPWRPNIRGPSRGTGKRRGGRRGPAGLGGASPELARLREGNRGGRRGRSPGLAAPVLALLAPAKIVAACAAL